MAFKKSKASSLSTDSPETLFRDLRSKRVQGLLAHQADILRDYLTSALEAPDVALQLPTGSGKTLVGLLLAEWRRRKFGERVLYLCPTIQLVHQVAQEAIGKYGIKVTTFTGSRREYSAADKSSYHSADTVAVATYSSLFNTNPFFSDAEVIILDDAHAAENYISKAWSLRIDRFNVGATYDLFANLLRPWIGETAYSRLRTYPDDPWQRTWVEKVPTPRFAEHRDEIAAFLDSHATDTDEMKYAWQLLRDHLHACHIYFSPREILIRPLIPPTASHPPFAKAKQRVYMSATLGAGGDLERITGRRAIKRLRLPDGWDAQGVGRRFFILPEAAISGTELQDLLGKFILEAGRVLVLVPDEGTADDFRKRIENELHFRVFDAREIESSKEAFVTTERAAAVLANRYDGIDLPEEECRLLIIQGLPSATNLQERFFVDRLGAGVLLSDRILTRVTQAFGRCTRSATDFAAVVICGEQLHKYVVKRDRRQFMHPELQAEIEFGIEQSKGASSRDFIDNLRAFLDQSADWESANDDIIARRQETHAIPLPGASELRAAVEFEIDFNDALWNGDFVGAYDACRKVLAKLTDSEMRGYRALWHYLAGSSALMASTAGTVSLAPAAREQFAAASGAAASIPWLTEVASMHASGGSPSDVDASRLSRAIERVEVQLQRLGVLHDRTFDDEESRIWKGLTGKDVPQFETAHASLGQMLGFDSDRGTTQAAPDAWWVIDDRLCIVFEDHSDGKATTSLNVTKARQAASHPNWIREHVPLAPDAEIVPVIVSPVERIDRDARPHLHGVRYWSLKDFREWARVALATIRAVRRTFAQPGDINWRTEAAQAFESRGLSSRQILQTHLARAAGDLPTS